MDGVRVNSLLAELRTVVNSPSITFMVSSEGHAHGQPGFIDVERVGILVVVGTSTGMG